MYRILFCYSVIDIRFDNVMGESWQIYILKPSFSRHNTKDFGSSSDTFMTCPDFWAVARNSRVLVEIVELSRSKIPIIASCLMTVSFPRWRYILSPRWEYFSVFDKEFILCCDIGITAGYEDLTVFEFIEKIILSCKIKLAQDIVKENYGRFSFWTA